MKKLLLLIFVLPFGLMAADKPADKLIEFFNMEKKHKQDWLDYKKSNYQAKIDMIKKHKADIFDMKMSHIRKMATGEKMDQVLNNKLHDMVKMHEKHNEDWKKLHDSQCKKGDEIGDQHNKELADFKKSIE
jgi:hypothetical protein